MYFYKNRAFGFEEGIMHPRVVLFDEITPEKFRQVYKEIKEGKIKGDRKFYYIKKAIEEHPEFEAYLKGDEVDSLVSPDPFWHLLLHVVVEETLERNDPPEISHFYTTQQAKGVSHHEIIHMLGAILILQLWTVIKEIQYDYEACRQMLREFASYSPAEFWKRLGEYK